MAQRCFEESGAAMQRLSPRLEHADCSLNERSLAARFEIERPRLALISALARDQSFGQNSGPGKRAQLANDLIFGVETRSQFRGRIPTLLEFPTRFSGSEIGPGFGTGFRSWISDRIPAPLTIFG